MIASRLPNGFIVLVMSPREAVNVGDQILEPEAYPWQGSEAMMDGMSAKRLIREQVEIQAEKDLNTARRNLANQAQDQENRIEDGTD